MIRLQQHLIHIALITALFASSHATAQDADAKPAPYAHALSSAVDGAKVKAADGTSLGDVDDLIVDTKTHRIVFAIVSTGGVLGIGERLTAVPFGVLSVDDAAADGSLTSQLLKKNIEMAPKYEHDRLAAHLADEQWRAETRAAFGAYPDDAMLPMKAAATESPAGAKGEASTPMSQRFRRVDKLVDGDVVAAAPPTQEPEKKDDVPVETFAGIDDLIINKKAGTVVAVLTSRGGIAGIDSEKFIVPVAALEFAKDGTNLRVNRSLREMTRAPRVDKEPIARFENKEYRASLATFYGIDLD